MCEEITNSIKLDSFDKESFSILHEAYLSKKLVLFVGAGVDKFSGLPLWGEAIEEFCHHLNIENDDRVDNLKIPQYYYNARGKKEYVELCRKIFRYNQEAPINNVHKKIIDFNVNTIITTNYTDFLEQEMKNRGHIYRVICQDKDLPYTKNENLIIKMHGDFEHDNFVLKEDDYLSYSENFRLMETYIKSLIAKNIFLFVGYSFNDPDIKQLFSWVKDILDTDFQHAYMLEGYKEFEKNEFEYYKNLGVNLIYTKKLISDKTFKAEKNPDKDIELKLLLKALDMITEGIDKKISNLEEVKKYFLPYSNLNYILERYINMGLKYCNLKIDDGVLKGLKEDKETWQLLSNLCEQLEKQLIPTDPYCVILSIIKRSGVKKIEKKIVRGKQYIEVPKENLQFNKLLNNIFVFDYNMIKNHVNYNNYSYYDNEKTYLQQAYIHYILTEYEQAYIDLSIAADISYKNHNYYNYYIAQFNKFRVKENFSFNIMKEDIHKKIEKDIKSINLDSIIMGIPSLSFNDNQLLKDIGSFQLHYSLFQDVYSMFDKIRINNEYLHHYNSNSSFSDIKMNDYIKIKRSIQDYYIFLVYNNLMVDHCIPIKEIFSLYINNSIQIINSLYSEENIKKVIRNKIHLPKIEVFDLFLMIKYLSETEILNLLSQININSYSVTEDCEKYISKVLENISHKSSFFDEYYYWNAIAIASFFLNNYTTIEKTVNIISIKINFRNYQQHMNTIYKFLKLYEKFKINVKKQNSYIKLNLQFSALGKFINELVDQIKKIMNTDIISDYSEIILRVVCCYKNTYEYDYNIDLNDLINNKQNLLIAKLYPHYNKQNKKIIKDYFKNWNEDVSWASCEVFYYIVKNDIINNDLKNIEIEYEKKILDYIRQKQLSNSLYNSDENQNILAVMCDLSLNNRLILKTEYNKIFKNFRGDVFGFLYDMEKFNYDKFKLEWLYFFDDGLLDRIAMNQKARTNIRKKVLEKVENDQISKELLKIYLRSFK